MLALCMLPESYKQTGDVKTRASICVNLSEQLTTFLNLQGDDPAFATAALDTAATLFDFATQHPGVARAWSVQVRLTYGSAQSVQHRFWAAAMLAWVHRCSDAALPSCDVARAEQFYNSAVGLFQEAQVCLNVISRMLQICADRVTLQLASRCDITSTFFCIQCTSDARSSTFDVLGSEWHATSVSGSPQRCGTRLGWSAQLHSRICAAAPAQQCCLCMRTCFATCSGRATTW